MKRVPQIFGGSAVEPLAHLRRGISGAVLVPVLMVIMVLMTLGIALLGLTMQSLQLTKRIQNTTLAFNLAESGAERAMRWLKDQPSAPPGSSVVDPFHGAQVLDPGTYEVTLMPDPSNSGAALKAYTINSAGTVGHVTEHVRLFVRQQSFGKYAYFTDQEISSITGGRIWFFSGDRIRGPAHSNNVGASNFQVDWTSTTQPIFQDMVTSVGTSVAYTPSNPSTESQFSTIYKAGSRGYQLGVDPIPLPSSSDIQKFAAWGTNVGLPSTTGVYVPTNGGIYIVGDSSVVMQKDGSGNQQFVITQGTKVTTVTVDLTLNQTRYQTVTSGHAGPLNTNLGIGSQVLFSTGNITSLSGTIANNLVDVTHGAIASRSAYTIATDVNNNKNITVTGNIKYATAPNVALPWNDPSNLASGTLGLIGRNVTIASGTPTNLEVDGIVLAGSSSTTDGSFSVADYNTKKPTGTLKVVGGIIQKARGPVGTLVNGAINTGYAKDYYYDSRLADAPPPFFPTTGLYDRLSWQRLVPTNG